jgi:hypothetical protein
MKKDTEKEMLSPQASTHVSRRSLLLSSLGGVTAMGALGAPKPILASDLGMTHAGAKPHTAREKLSEIVSVKRFGAKGD